MMRNLLRKLGDHRVKEGDRGYDGEREREKQSLLEELGEHYVEGND